jgi:cytochrome c-type biogenesis protein CcmH
MKTLTLIAVMAFGSALTGADLEREARALEAMIIAPCCFSQQVSVHQSPAADEVRKDVRLRLAAGETREQILNAYVSRYGKRILAEPPAEGFDLALYLLPPLMLLGSAAVVVWLVRRFSGRAVAGATEPARLVPGGDYDEKLDDELRDLD